MERGVGVGEGRGGRGRRGGLFVFVCMYVYYEICRLGSIAWILASWNCIGLHWVGFRRAALLSVCV